MTARLLQQNIFVARRSWLLWLSCGLLFVISAAARYDTDGRLGVTPALGIVYAFFAAVYLGEAGTSGRIDGQIIRGAPRAQIYFAAWLTVTGCFVLILLCTVSGDLIGSLAAGTLSGSAVGWLIYIGAMILNAAAYAALYVFVCLLATGRGAGRPTIALIICAAVLIGMLIWVNGLQSALMEPEYYLPEAMGDDVVMYMPVDDPADLDPADLVQNPDYVPEPTRSAYWATLRFLPLAQAIMLPDIPDARPVWGDLEMAVLIMLDSCILAAACVALGTVLFARRELD